MAGAAVVSDLSGQLDLLETGAVMERCDVVVTNDTGLMHIASAKHRKVVAVFGSTVREFGFFPYGTQNIVIERKDVPCRPCSHIGLAEWKMSNTLSPNCFVPPTRNDSSTKANIPRHRSLRCVVLPLDAPRANT
jgi:ADP-heptose:LPS heptosyltransferase